MTNIIPMQRKPKSCAEKLSFWLNEKFAPKPEPKKPMATRNRAPDRDPRPPSAA
jgi:hypothetical protein